jgi:hypothetical protein
MASPGEDDVRERAADDGLRFTDYHWQVFERLRQKVDPAKQKQQEDALNARLFAQQQKSQERLSELVRPFYCSNGAPWTTLTSSD